MLLRVVPGHTIWVSEVCSNHGRYFHELVFVLLLHKFWLVYIVIPTCFHSIVLNKHVLRVFDVERFLVDGQRI